MKLIQILILLGFIIISPHSNQNHQTRNFIINNYKTFYKSFWLLKTNEENVLFTEIIKFINHLEVINPNLSKNNFELIPILLKTEKIKKIEMLFKISGGKK